MAIKKFPFDRSKFIPFKFYNRLFDIESFPANEHHGFFESLPAVSAKLKAPITADRKFEDVVKSAQDAAVLVLVY